MRRLKLVMACWLCACGRPLSADWVEISQQRYQKPVRLGTPTRDGNLETMNTVYRDVTRDTYSNNSISEHGWNQHFQLPTRRNDVTTNGQKHWHEPLKEHGVRTTSKPFERNKYEVKESESKRDEAVIGKIERVPNIGSVKRVQLANTPVKSPVVKIKERYTDRGDSVRHGTPNYESDDLDLETDKFKDIEEAVHSSDTFKTVFSNGEDIPREGYRNSTVTKVQVKTHMSNIGRNPFTPLKDLETDKVTQASISNSKNNQDGILQVFETPGDNEGIGLNTERTERLGQNEGGLNDNGDDAFLTKINKDKTQVKHIQKSKEIVEDKRNTNNINADIDLVKKRPKDKNPINSDSGEAHFASAEIKVNTMENILKFIKVVAETISKNTRREANGKIMYLNELKHTLLANIKERIDAAWPDDTSAAAAASRRRSRSAQARGHVDFPSSESSLMTISFLTFAVFLIKLVLQVIQTYKHKTMVMAPLVVATAGRALGGTLRTSSDTLIPPNS